jgi:hypothetical protein
MQPAHCHGATKIYAQVCALAKAFFFIILDRGVCVLK